MASFDLNGHCFTSDNEILWIKLPKEGSPLAWQPGTNYSIGDNIVPTVIAAGQENLMFQVAGFMAKSGSSEPAFGTTIGDKTIDGDIEFITQNKVDDLPQLEFNQHFLIDEEVTAQ